jgi:hypothetical protein
MSSHQALLNLQGGSSGEYYHLTSAQWAGVLAAGWASATHTHSYLPLSGGSLSGNLAISTAGAAGVSLFGASGFVDFNSGGNLRASFWNDGNSTYLDTYDSAGLSLITAMTFVHGSGVSFAGTLNASVITRGGTNLDSLFASIGHAHSYTAVFATISHTHSYLPLTGGTLTGELHVASAGASSVYIRGSAGYLIFREADGSSKFSIWNDGDKTTYFDTYDTLGASLITVATLMHGSGISVNGTLNATVLTRSNVNLDSIYASAGHAHSYTAVFATIAHTHSYLPLTGGNINGDVSLSGTLNATTYLRGGTNLDSIFASAGHTHTTFLPLSGGSMSGALVIDTGRISISLSSNTNASVRLVQTGTAEALAAAGAVSVSGTLNATVYLRGGTNLDSIFASAGHTHTTFLPLSGGSMSGALVIDTGSIQISLSSNSTVAFRVSQRGTADALAVAGATSLSGTLNVAGTILRSGTNLDSVYASTGHVHAASAITSGIMAAAILGSATADTTTFLRGDSRWVTVAAGTEYIFRTSTSTVTAGAFQTWQHLNADQVVSSSATPVVMMSTQAVGAGTWNFAYHIIYQSAATTTGLGITVNHTGASPGNYVMQAAFASTGGAAATGVADQVQSSQTAGLIEAKAERVLNTISSQTVGVDTANTNCYIICSGALVVTNSGDLQLKVSSEVNGSNITVKSGSHLILCKIT